MWEGMAIRCYRHAVKDWKDKHPGHPVVAFA
jgi:hypothetical protein